LSGFRLLPSGAFALDARIELARRAARSLDLQYFLIKSDATGHSILRALRDAALRGVRVRLLLDDLHTSGQDALLLGLAAHPNVEVRLFNPFASRQGGLFRRFAASVPEFERLNHRMHNKLFIADGAMAIAGGRNIADEYFTRHPLANFIDLDVFTTGVVVQSLAAIFDGYWNSPSAYPVQTLSKPSEPALDLQADFDQMTRVAHPPALQDMPATDALGYGRLARELDRGRLDLLWSPVEAFGDPPYPEADASASTPPARPGSPAPASRVRLNVLEHIRDARSEVVLVSPYLIPGRRGMDLIRAVRSRDVVVSVLTNSLASTDQPLAHIGYRRYRHELMTLGVELFELSPIKAGRESQRLLFGASVGGLHTKAVVFDREELFIGSMNFDPRSNHYNSEMGLFIHSPEVAGEAWRLAYLAKLQGAHRLRLLPGGGIEWLTPAGADDEVHTSEPEASFCTRVLLELLAPLAPEELL
jgi:putative cardiolipin synthase